MALITCPKCNKKYSDTVASCIHCGNPTQFTQNITAPPSAPSPAEPQVAKTAADESPLQKPEMVSYLTLPVQYQKELEAEFLSQNEWALKTEQRREAVSLFARSFLLSIPVALVMIFLLFNHTNWVANEQMLQFALYWSVALLCVGILGATVCVIWYFIAHTLTKKSQKWSELYREWLKKEKNIGEEDN